MHETFGMTNKLLNLRMRCAAGYRGVGQRNLRMFGGKIVQVFRTGASMLGTAKAADTPMTIKMRQCCKSCGYRG